MSGFSIPGFISRAVALGVAIAMLSAAACSSGDADRANTPTATSAAAAASVPGANERVALSGFLSLDGAPFDAEFLGVRVIRDGLATACQYTIPTVKRGIYGVQIVSDSEVRGCGAPGAEILLWVYTRDTFIFSTNAAPWPDEGKSVTFDGRFSSATPGGASKPVTEFKGRLFDRNGAALPGGTLIEAFAGEARCGVSSLRYGDGFEDYYTLIIAGPESVAACARDAALTFLLNGKPATETSVNDLKAGAEGHELNLTLE